MQLVKPKAQTSHKQATKQGIQRTAPLSKPRFTHESRLFCAYLCQIGIKVMILEASPAAFMCRETLCRFHTLVSHE